MAKQTLRDLIPNLTEIAIAPDTTDQVIDVDPESNPIAGEARTYTLV